MAHSPTGEPGRRAVACWLAVAALLLLAPFAAGAAGAAWAADEPGGESVQLEFSLRSQRVSTRSLASLRTVMEPVTVRVYEPYESREVAFVAFPFEGVLDAVYSGSWRHEEELLFTCSDGYQPTVPVERVLSHRAWLAFDRADEEGFSLLKFESGSTKRVELGPFYLIWENLEDVQMRQESDYGWPYQLVGVDLIRTRDHFPKMTPPAGATPEVLAGFAAFRVHCSKCHKLNGEGGSIGPELNAGANPVEYRDPQWLRTWIEDPTRIRPETRMPRLNPELPERERTVNEILAYLQAMVAARDSTGER